MMAYFIGGNNRSGGELTQDLTVAVGAGQAVGGSITGELFTRGTPIETVLRDILIKSFDPVLLLSSNIIEFVQECGTVISPTLNTGYTANNGGALLSQSLKKNGTVISIALPYTDNNIVFPDGDIDYMAVGLYAAGALPAGSVNSNTISYQGRRKMFAGTPAATPTTSAHVRALAGSVIDPAVGTQLLIPIAMGSTKVVFAYPANLPDVSSVLYVELSNSEVKSLFTKTLVNVEAANGFAAVSYKVYTYTPIQPFQTAVNYRVII